MNVLELVSEVCRRLALDVPNSVVGNADQTISQIGSILNEEGQDLRARYRWQSTVARKTWNALAAQDQGLLIGSGSPPNGIFLNSDNLDYIIDSVLWNDTTRLPVYGPNSPQKRQARAVLPLTGPYTEYFIRNNHLYLNPQPNLNDQMSCEYVTKSWLTDETGTIGKYYIGDDTDIITLDETLIILGVLWRWKQIKGFDYGEDFNKYERKVADAMARDGTKPILNYADGELNNTIEPIVIVSAGGWPLS